MVGQSLLYGLFTVLAKGGSAAYVRARASE